MPNPVQEWVASTRYTMGLSRRDFLTKSISTVAMTGISVSTAQSMSLHCTPAPKFPVGKHDYHVSFIVDRSLPLEQLDCDLGPETFAHHGCATPPLLDVDWKIWDGKTLVKSWHADPVRSSAWAATETSCLLGAFEGKRNGMFALEWTVNKDPGRLRELHPRIEIVKNPGYWCWL